MLGVVVAAVILILQIARILPDGPRRNLPGRAWVVLSLGVPRIIGALIIGGALGLADQSCKR